MRDTVNLAQQGIPVIGLIHEPFEKLARMAETLPGFEMLSWFGLLAPAGTPPAIVNRMNAETTKVLANPDVRSLLAAQGFEVMSGTPEQFGDYIKVEIAKITKLAKTTGIKAE